MRRRGGAELVRPSVRRMAGYVPGEQPARKRLIKLNTNENPYPPSPKVLEATREAVDGRLRLYPDPAATRLRTRLAKLHQCEPENILVGNGSDELLAVCIRACVEPLKSVAARRRGAATVQYFDPSYSLYPVLAETHAARRHAVRLDADFGLPAPDADSSDRGWEAGAALSLVTTPNAPSGRGYRTSELRWLCKATDGVVVLDEAYADFADENALGLASELRNVVILRTFSKAYSLCFQRIGYAVAHADLIAELAKVRDSYSVNGLGQLAALTTLGDRAYYRESIARIRTSRDALAANLEVLGFRVLPSQTNFLFVEPPVLSAEDWFNELRERRILVRWFAGQRVRRYLRITIGTGEEITALLQAAKHILAT
jgi:histidinol-phosphate aminotransferase